MTTPQSNLLKPATSVRPNDQVAQFIKTSLTAAARPDNRVALINATGPIYFRTARLLTYPSALVWPRLRSIWERSQNTPTSDPRFAKVALTSPDQARAVLSQSWLSTLAVCMVGTTADNEAIYTSLRPYVLSTRSMKGVSPLFLTVANTLGRAGSNLFADAAATWNQLGPTADTGLMPMFDSATNSFGLVDGSSLSGVSIGGDLGDAGSFMGGLGTNMGLGDGGGPAIGPGSSLAPGGLPIGGGTEMTETQCQYAFKVGGALIGGAAAGSASGGMTAKEGATAGWFVGDLLGGLVCGSLVGDKPSGGGNGGGGGQSGGDGGQSGGDGGQSGGDQNGGQSGGDESGGQSGGDQSGGQSGGQSVATKAVAASAKKKTTPMV